MGRPMRVAAMCLIGALAVHSQAPSRVEADAPTVVKFVAPAYPRAAKDKRIMGKTITRVSVGNDGAVKEVKTVLAHPVFESYILDAHPITSETHVSSELPSVVHIRTGLQCIERVDR